MTPERALSLVVDSSRRQAGSVRWAYLLAARARWGALPEGERRSFQGHLSALPALQGMDPEQMPTGQLAATVDALSDEAYWLPASLVALRQSERERPRDPDAEPTAPDPERWAERAAAERALEEGSLGAERLADPDPYVRALARLACPPPIDPSLAFGPWLPRAAVYLAARGLAEPDAWPLSALCLLDEDLPGQEGGLRQGLAHLLREIAGRRLPEQLAPYLEVFRAIDAAPSRPHPAPDVLDLARQALQAVAQREPGDVFAPLRAVPLQDAVSALIAALSDWRPRSWSPEVLRFVAALQDPLAALLCEAADAARSRPFYGFRRNVPFAWWGVYREARGKPLVGLVARSRLRWAAPAICLLPARVLALETSPRAAGLATTDPLLLLAGEIPLADPGDPLIPLALRRVLDRPSAWLDRLRSTGALGDEEGAERIDLFLSGFVRTLVEAAQPAAPRTSDPVERQLLDAIAAAPSDPEPRLVYADWCAQRGLEPRPPARAELMRALREAFARGDGAIDRLHLALASARLGEPLEVALLADALLQRPALRPSILDALFALGPAAAPAQPALRALVEDSLEAAALLLLLEPGAVRAAEVLLAGLRSALRDDLPIRRAVAALPAVAAHHPALAEALQAVAALLLERLSPERFPDEIAVCRRLLGAP